MSGFHSTGGKRVVVWVQHFADRPYLMLQWHDPVTGNRKSKSAGTNNPLDAEQRRADLEYELNHGFYQQADRMSWAAFRDLFDREYAAGRRPGTRARYEDVFNLFEELCHPGRLASVTERTVSAFLLGMRGRKVRGRIGMAVYTMKVNLDYLHTALHWAARQKLIPACPEFPTVKVPKKRPQPVPAESFERLVAKAPDDSWRALLWAGWLAGLRVSESYALEWGQSDKVPWLDFGRNRIVLPAEFAKADEDQWVPLDPRLRGMLDALPRQGKKVFPLRARDGHRLALSSVADAIIRLAKKAGVKLTSHSLRKGFGCRYAGKVPAQVLQRLMRHSNIRITMDYYANIDDAVEAAVLGDAQPHSRNSSRNSDGFRAAAPEEASARSGERETAKETD
jgi:integrase